MVYVQEAAFIQSLLYKSVLKRWFIQSLLYNGVLSGGCLVVILTFVGRFGSEPRCVKTLIIMLHLLLLMWLFLMLLSLSALSSYLFKLFFPKYVLSHSWHLLRAYQARLVRVCD
jgi:hypothetical protein